MECADWKLTYRERERERLRLTAYTSPQKCTHISRKSVIHGDIGFRHLSARPFHLAKVNRGAGRWHRLFSFDWGLLLRQTHRYIDREADTDTQDMTTFNLRCFLSVYLPHQIPLPLPTILASYLLEHDWRFFEHFTVSRFNCNCLSVCTSLPKLSHFVMAVVS